MRLLSMAIGRAKYINITNGWIKQQDCKIHEKYISSFVFLSASPEQLDLVAVMGSSNKNPEILSAQKKFIVDLFNSYKISPEAMLPGILTYSLETIVGFGDVTDNKYASQYVTGMNDADFGNNLQLALDYDAVFDSSRENVRRSLLVFVDNKDDVTDQFKNKIRELANENIKVVLIGIGNKVGKVNLERITKEPDAVIFVKIPADLPNQKNIVRKILDGGNCFSFIIFTVFSPF